MPRGQFFGAKNRNVHVCNSRKRIVVSDRGKNIQKTQRVASTKIALPPPFEMSQLEISSIVLYELATILANV